MALKDWNWTQKIVAHASTYGLVYLAIVYESTRLYILGGCALIVGWYIFKAFHPESIEDSIGRHVDRDNMKWDGDLLAHENRRRARESVYQREEMHRASQQSIEDARSSSEERKGITAFPLPEKQ